MNWSSNRGRWGTVLSTAMDPATNAMDAVARWMNATLRDSGFLGCTASVTFNPEKVLPPKLGFRHPRHAKYTYPRPASWHRRNTIPLDLDPTRMRVGTELLKRRFAKMQNACVVVDGTDAAQPALPAA